jgi:membrane associated rhomboid family serine protease
VKWSILVFAVIELISEVANFTDGVAHATHLFGFLFAFIILVLFFKTNPIKNMFFPDRDNYIIH